MLDVPGLEELLTALHRRELRVVEVETPTASPFASSLLFDYVATYMYEGDTPERRAARGRALARPRPAARAARPGGAARPDRPGRARPGRGRPAAPLGPHRAPTRATALADVLRRARRPDRRRGRATACSPALDAERCCSTLGRRAPRRARCASPASSAGSPPTTPGSTATRSAPSRRAGCPRRSSPTSTDALEKLVARYARTHGPFTTDELRARYGVDPTRGCASSSATASSSAASCGPAGREREWCDPEVLRRLRRASLAVLRKEIEAVRPARARRLPARRGRASTAIRPAGAGVDRLREVLVPLQGLALPADVWERDVLPRRIGAYSPTWLDQLCASGEVVWVGAGALGRNSGRVALYFRDDAEADRPAADTRASRPAEPEHDAIRERLAAVAVLLHRPARRARRSRPRSSRRRCGTSSGRARRPTTRSRRCARRG